MNAPLHRSMRIRNTFAGHGSAVYALALDSAGAFLSGGSEGAVVRWSPLQEPDGARVAQLPRPVFSLLRTADHLLAGLDDGALHVLDLRRKTEVKHLRLHSKGVFGLMPDHDAKVLFSIGGEGSLGIWRWPAMELQRQLPLTDAKLRAMALSPDGHWLAVSDNGGRVHVLETAEFNELITIDAHDGGAYGLAFHPSKPVLMSGGRDGRLRAWKMEGQWEKLLDVQAHTGSIYSIAFGPGGRYMATASRDKSAKVWDAGSLDALHKLDRASGGHTHSVNDLLWLADGSLLTAGDDKRVVQWADG